MSKKTYVIPSEHGLKIAQLINSCVVWKQIALEALAVTDTGEPDPELPTYRRWHDEAARELNQLLGHTAIHLFDEE